MFNPQISQLFLSKNKKSYQTWCLIALSFMWIFYCCQNVAIWGFKTLECLVNMAFSEFVLLLCKSLYSLWGNFCYPLSILFKLRIKLSFYCQKSCVYRAFGHRKSDLKDCSSRSLKDIKIYTLQDNGCCTITLRFIPTPWQL